MHMGVCVYGRTSIYISHSILGNAPFIVYFLEFSLLNNKTLKIKLLTQLTISIARDSKNTFVKTIGHFICQNKHRLTWIYLRHGRCADLLLGLAVWSQECDKNV